MLDVNFENVLHLEHLPHPGGTKVCKVLRIVFLRLVRVQSTHWSARVLVHDGMGSAVGNRLRFFAIVFLQGWNLELKVLLLLCMGRTAPILDCLQIGHERVVVARLCLTTAELAEEFELKGLDALAALAVVAVNPDVHQLARVVLVF